MNLKSQNTQVLSGNTQHALELMQYVKRAIGPKHAKKL